MPNAKLIHITYFKAGHESLQGYFPILSKNQMLIFIIEKNSYYVYLFKHTVHAFGKLNMRNRKIHILRNLSWLKGTYYKGHIH
jgi:hypothetical protein